MEQWTSVDEVLDFAISNEEEAAQFYTDLAQEMDREWMKEVFQGFAREEKGHKAKLLEIKEGKRLLKSESKVLDLKLADYLVSPETTQKMDYQQALVLAMKKEKKAFQMYSDLADLSEEEDLKETFQALAQEEAKHKLKFEVEYDQYVLQEN
jgi:rubrerythrin